MTRLSRRHALLGGWTLRVPAACTPKPGPADPAEPLAGIDDRIGALATPQRVRRPVRGHPRWRSVHLPPRPGRFRYVLDVQGLRVGAADGRTRRADAGSDRLRRSGRDRRLIADDC